MKTRNRLSPLITILLATLIFSTGIGLAAWYWTSQSITSTNIRVNGWIEAKVVDPQSAWDSGSPVAYADLVEATEFIPGNTLGLDPTYEYAFIKVDGTNAAALYLKIEATRPEGMTVTCNVRLLAIFADYTWGSADLLVASDVALDGTQSINLQINEDPLYALKTFEGCTLFVVVEFNINQGTLPIGSHTMSAIFTLGDTP